MKIRKTTLSTLAAALLGLAASCAQAGTFSVISDIYNTATGTYSNTYVGNLYASGYVNDGGLDAFDNFGAYFNGLPQGIAIQRRVDVLTNLNTFRFIDTFTNTGAGTFAGQADFNGNLGSDGSEAVTTNTPYIQVSHDTEGGATHDPVIAIINGNNAWAQANTHAAITPNNYDDLITLNLASGQSVTVAHFAVLVRPNDNDAAYDPTASIASATDLANALVADPSSYFIGLSAAQIADIANFSVQSVPAGGAGGGGNLGNGAGGGTVPEPASLALLGLGAAGMLGTRRRPR